jgi:ubiquinone/menaquinone biosynthesis C-methylase UbiE
MDPETRPTRPFQSAVGFYDRYRLDYPPRLLARVAALAGLTPGDRVLDLGTGTGMLAIGFAKAGMAVTALDPEPEMLAAAAAKAEEAGVTVDFRPGGSADLDSNLGAFRLAVMGRSFHWMDRAATLAMLDQIILPEGGVALFHDAHPPVVENGWFKILCSLQDKFGRAAAPEIAERKGGHRRYEPFLFASAFTQLDGLSVTIRRALTEDEIVGRAFSMSVTAPERLGGRADEFSTALRQALRELSPDGTFTEVAELVALLARRPH